jgi:hypothetical protein
MQSANNDGAPVGRVSLADDPGTAFESVPDTSQRGWVQAGELAEGARAERAVADDEVQAIEVDLARTADRNVWSWGASDARPLARKPVVNSRWDSRRFQLAGPRAVDRS